MELPRFEWDPVKAAENARRHHVSFAEAMTVFEDEEALLVADPDHSIGEERFILLGLSSALRVLVVVHCEARDAAVIRVISARKADRSEREFYADRRR